MNGEYTTIKVATALARPLMSLTMSAGVPAEEKASIIGARAAGRTKRDILRRGVQRIFFTKSEIAGTTSGLLRLWMS